MRWLLLKCNNFFKKLQNSYFLGFLLIAILIALYFIPYKSQTTHFGTTLHSFYNDISLRYFMYMHTYEFLDYYLSLGYQYDILLLDISEQYPYYIIDFIYVALFCIFAILCLTKKHNNIKIYSFFIMLIALFVRMLVIVVSYNVRNAEYSEFYCNFNISFYLIISIFIISICISFLLHYFKKNADKIIEIESQFIKKHPKKTKSLTKTQQIEILEKKIEELENNYKGEN